MIVTEERIEAAVLRMDELPALILEARKAERMSEHRAKVYYASALTDANGTLKEREAAARLDEDYRKQKAANAEWSAKVAGLYAEKDALEFTRSVWQTENANNRRPL